jgi:hypothetical protein
MRLYTNNTGQWAGTQADAKQLDGEAVQVDVPTAKAELLDFLNRMQAHGAEMSDKELEDYLFSRRSPLYADADTPEVEAQLVNGCTKWSDKATIYDIHDAAAHASLKDLQTALGVYMSRLDAELNR